MSLGFRVGVPGLNVRVSTRGVRASAGPRIARVSVGSGRTRVSSGLGPFFASSSLGGSRSRSSGGSRGGVSPSRLLAEQRAAERARADAERAAAINQLHRTLNELTTVHRAHWPAATRPSISRLEIVDGDAVVKEARKLCLRGIGLTQREQRRQATNRADALAEQYMHDENQRLEAERADFQAQADLWWRLLIDNDEETVCEALNVAFSDNPAGGAALGVDGRNASVLIRQIDLASMPTHRPDVTPGGRPTTKKLTLKERHRLFLDSLVSNVAATLREGFAVAPGLNTVTICAVTRFERTQRLGPVILGRWSRRDVESMAWGQPDDALQLVLDRNLELELVQAASGEAKPLSPVGVEGLERLMSVLHDSRGDEEAAGGHEAGLDPTRLRPRTFEDWRNTRTAPSPQPSPPSPSTSHPPPLPPPAAGIPVASGSVTPLVIKSRDGRLTVQATSSNEVDVSVLLLDDQSRTRGDSDFVFYNAPRSPHGAVVLAAASHEGRAQAVAVDVGRLREEGVRRCAVIVSSARPLEDGHVRVSLQTGQDRDLELPLPREPGLLAAVVAEVYLRPSTIDDWRVRALAQGWADGLAGVVRSYGVAVDD